MIPILFEKNEVDFSTNGLGRLIDCTSCKVTEERNGIYELEFTYPITGKFYNKMVSDGGIVCTWHDDHHDIQPFEIYAHTDPIDGVSSFYAHHISYKLNNIIVSPFHAESPAEAITKLKNMSVNENPFEFLTDKSGSSDFDISHPESIRSLLFGNKGSILDVYGGEYEFDWYTVKLHANRGQNTDATIRYGKNLLNIEKEYDEGNIFTAVAPYWVGSDGRTVYPQECIVPSNNAPSEYENWTNENGEELTDENGNAIQFASIGLGIIPVPLDLSSEFSDQPRPNDLRKKAIKYIDENKKWIPESNITIDFIALWQTPEYSDVAILQRLSLCDKVSIYYPELNVIAENQKIIKVVYDVLLERYSEMELGDRPKTYSESISEGLVSEEDYKNGLNNFKDEVAKSRNNLQLLFENEVSRATKMISGGLGGYVVLKLNANGQPEELLVMDTPDIETAVNVWRFNQSGLGHSSNGYNGPFSDIALTSDGRINASLITTGALNANIIKVGLLQDANGLNYWNLETGEFRLAALSDYATDAEVASAINTFSETLTQLDIFNRLTNNGETQGIYLSNGKLYINGTFIQAGAINAGLIQTGIVASANGKVYFDLDNNELCCSKIVQNTSEVRQSKVVAEIEPHQTNVASDAGAFKIYKEYSDGTADPNPFRINFTTDGYANLVSNDVAVTSLDSSGYGASNIRVKSGSIRLEAQGARGTGPGAILTLGYNAGSAPYAELSGSMDISDGLRIRSGGLSVTGTKNRQVATPNYGNRLLYCYETSSPMFGDIGEGFLDENGLCYIDIDDILSETINLNIEYQVFLQKESSGDIWVKEKARNYFVVEGTPNMKFAWELKAKQIDYEYLRLEDPEIEESRIDNRALDDILEYERDLFFSEMEESLL